VPWNDPVRIKPVLDLGANGIIVPNVKTADEAALAVQACLYPPNGIRGYGPRQSADWLSYRIPASEYVNEANEAVFKVVQIESVEGVANIDDILAIPELDCVTLGPMDLSASMGLLGQPNHPAVKDAIRTVMEKTRRAGKILGYPAVFTDDLSPAMELIRQGVQWLSVGQDVSFLRGSGERALCQLQTLMKK
jgi:2-keto-3-deoxy-L-rhamnonate aldolase RhmA